MVSSLRLISLVLVSILGLVSCNAIKEAGQSGDGGGGEHRAGPAPRPTDSWKISEPTVETAESGRAGRPIKHAIVEPVPADAVIAFSDPSKQGDAAFANVTFEVLTTCESSLGTLNAESKLTGTRRIPVRSLLPPALWRRLELGGDKNPVCTFTFKAFNQHKSSHGFTFERVEIAHFPRLENLHFKDARSGKMVAPVSALTENDIHALRVPELPEAGAETNFDLLCDKFKNSRRAPGPQLPTSLAHQLFSGRMQSSGPEVTAIDSRLTDSLQNCRVVADSIDAKTGLRQVWISPKLRIQFPLRTPDFIYKMGVYLVGQPGFRYEDLNGKTWFHLRLQNTQQYTMAFRFPNLAATTLQLQPIAQDRNTGTGYHGKIFENPLTISLSSGNRMWPHGPDTVIELKPGAELTVQARITSNIACAGSPHSEAEAAAAQIHVIPYGLAYRFGHALYLKQYLNWNPTSPQLGGETKDVSPLNFSTESHGQILEGWAPYAESAPFNPTLARPAILLPYTAAPMLGCYHDIFRGPFY